MKSAGRWKYALGSPMTTFTFKCRCATKVVDSKLLEAGSTCSFFRLGTFWQMLPLELSGSEQASAFLGPAVMNFGALAQSNRPDMADFTPLGSLFRVRNGENRSKRKLTFGNRLPWSRSTHCRHSDESCLRLLTDGERTRHAPARSARARITLRVWRIQSRWSSVVAGRRLPQPCQGDRLPGLRLDAMSSPRIRRPGRWPSQLPIVIPTPQNPSA